MKSYHSIVLYIILMLLQFGCKSESNVTVYKIKKNNSTANQNKAKQKNTHLNWAAPNNWIEKIPTDFRLVSYDIPTSNGVMIDLSITTFPGNAGGIAQNVNRWRRQVNLEPQNIDSIIKGAQKESSMLGEYFIFELKNELNTQAIIAAIIPYLDDTDSVVETIFIKMSGSDNNLQELKYEFELFCKSIHWQQ